MNKVTIALASLVVLIVGAFLMFVQPKGPVENQTNNQNTMNTNQPSGAVSDLGIVDTVVGTGALAVPGKEITVQYTGKLVDGTKFDSSYDHGSPFTFPLGAGRVIRGWDEGFAGMKVGGKRTLTIPPELGYGASGSGGVIPPNAVLIFDVELLDVR